MRPMKLILATVAVTLLWGAADARAQRSGLSNSDRLFLVYNQINQNRQSQQLALQQQQLSRQFQQFSQGQSPFLSQMPDPIESFVEQAQTGRRARTYVPPIYAPQRRQGYFQGHARYFNAPR